MLLWFYAMRDPTMHVDKNKYYMSYCFFSLFKFHLIVFVLPVFKFLELFIHSSSFYSKNIIDAFPEIVDRCISGKFHINNEEKGNGKYVNIQASLIQTCMNEFYKKNISNKAHREMNKQQIGNFKINY